MSRIQLNDLNNVTVLNAEAMAAVGGGYSALPWNAAAAWGIVQWHANQMKRINNMLSLSTKKLLARPKGSSKNSRPCTLTVWNGRFGYCE